jgi:hypothetical protein
MTSLVVAAVMSVAYAVWAFTARRSIFADFSAGRAVTLHDARASDTIDTVLLVVTGITVVIAVILWAAHFTRRPEAGRRPQHLGFALAAVGVVVVAVGIWLDGAVTDAPTQLAQGDRGITAAVICGSGFLLLAVGLLVGAAALLGTGEAPAGDPPVDWASRHPWKS